MLDQNAQLDWWIGMIGEKAATIKLQKKALDAAKKAFENVDEVWMAADDAVQPPRGHACLQLLRVEELFNPKGATGRCKRGGN